MSRSIWEEYHYLDNLLWELLGDDYAGNLQILTITTGELTKPYKVPKYYNMKYLPNLEVPDKIDNELFYDNCWVDRVSGGTIWYTHKKEQFMVTITSWEAGYRPHKDLNEQEEFNDTNFDN